MVHKVNAVFVALVSLFLQARSSPVVPAGAGVSGREQADIVVGSKLLLFSFHWNEHVRYKGL